MFPENAITMKIYEADCAKTSFCKLYEALQNPVERFDLLS